MVLALKNLKSVHEVESPVYVSLAPPTPTNMLVFSNHIVLFSIP